MNSISVQKATSITVNQLWEFANSFSLNRQRTGERSHLQIPNAKEERIVSKHAALKKNKAYCRTKFFIMLFPISLTFLFHTQLFQKLNQLSLFSQFAPIIKQGNTSTASRSYILSKGAFPFATAECDSDPHV